ncbi:hypothetical protein GGR53DRAFT_518925 [Hypoxylon sp. FL1150]|nr:hypothetical protein GGR53DRAFT_518925 [Hypoxylon sp. FL1150]
MSNQFKYIVYDGIWVNWSYGRVLGATVTLSQDNGTLLIAFIAFFTAIIGTSLWRIICYIFYHLFSSPTLPNDALYHQRQAILRNAQSPFMGIRTFTSLLWTWRKEGRRVFIRILPVLVRAVMVAIGLAVASGFSSRVARDNEILVVSEDCHWTTSSFGPGTAMIQQTDMMYARDCYPLVTPNSLAPSTSSGSLGCNSYIKRYLPYTVDTNASCPFAKEICKTEDKNIYIDSGYYDSHVDLGMNAPPSERFQYRTTLHCAPLITTNYTTTINASTTKSYTRYFYGQDMVLNNTYTHHTSNDAYTEPPYRNGSVDTRMSGWVPIPELSAPGSELSLLFLEANSVLYENKLGDPWYEATKPMAKIRYYYDNSTRVLYGANTPASPLACISREQYCKVDADSNARRCTDLTGPLDLAYTARDVFPDEGSWNRFNWFYSCMASAPSMLIEIFMMLELTLLSRSTLQSGYQTSLQDRSWQSEVEYWFATIMSALQRVVSDAAAGGDVGPDDLKWLQKPNLTEEWKLCESQKVRSPYHTSFSLFGILFILCFGSLTIILSVSLDSLARIVGKYRKSDQNSSLEWALNETLQLQRLAHEELGIGPWSRGAKTIPLVESSAELAILDSSNPKHPRMLLPPKEETSSRTSTAHLDSTIAPELHPEASHDRIGAAQIIDELGPQPDHTTRESGSMEGPATMWSHAF